MSSPSIDDLIKQVQQLKKQDNYSEAKAVAESLCQYYPDEPDAWRTAAYLESHEGNYRSAIDYISRCIVLRPEEPAFVFKRSRDYLYIGEYELALQDADQTLKLSNALNSTYYVDTALFYKAEALFKLGRYQEAITVAESLPQGTGHWLNEGMRTREDILAGARSRLRP